MRTFLKKLIHPVSLIILLVLFIVSCHNEDENCHNELIIVNNSDNSIYFHPSTRYPDTLTLYPNPAINPGQFKIEDHSSQKDIYRSCIESTLITIPEGTIMYFIYDAITLETLPWDTVVKHYMILKRYDLKLDDLEQKNWTIIYP